MGWDRKRRGEAGGYFYKSVRLPGEPHPVKVYFGRTAAGQLAAADVEQRRQERRAAADAARVERAATAEADRLAAELHEWADLLFTAWMVLTGHHLHHGCWRRRNAQESTPSRS